MDRRNFVKLGGAVTGAGLISGCTGGSDGGGWNSGNGEGKGGGGGNRSSDDTFKNHPATKEVSTRPSLGPDDASAKIVAFEDPSCPKCAKFNLGPFQKIKSKLIDQGKLQFYYRTITVVYPWGKPAAESLEATYKTDHDAFWGLKHYYYENQLGGGASNEDVYSLTRDYLENETDLDADKIIKEAKNKKYHDRIQENLKASKKAGVRGTPSFFLFKNGDFRTKVVGPQSFSVFKNALGE
ncbi:MAG: DsbA family protein [Halobacteria archaeon]